MSFVLKLAINYPTIHLFSNYSQYFTNGCGHGCGQGRGRGRGHGCGRGRGRGHRYLYDLGVYMKQPKHLKLKIMLMGSKNILCYQQLKYPYG